MWTLSRTEQQQRRQFCSVKHKESLYSALIWIKSTSDYWSNICGKPGTSSSLSSFLLLFTSATGSCVCVCLMLLRWKHHTNNIKTTTSCCLHLKSSSAAAFDCLWFLNSHCVCVCVFSCSNLCVTSICTEHAHWSKSPQLYLIQFEDETETCICQRKIQSPPPPPLPLYFFPPQLHFQLLLLYKLLSVNLFLFAQFNSEV